MHCVLVDSELIIWVCREVNYNQEGLLLVANKHYNHLYGDSAMEWLISHLKVIWQWIVEYNLSFLFMQAQALIWIQLLDQWELTVGRTVWKLLPLKPPPMLIKFKWRTTTQNIKCGWWPLLEHPAGCRWQ